MITASNMLFGLFVYCCWLLLLCGSSIWGDMDSEPVLPTDCYMIQESRARLAAKDCIETLEINFTEFGDNYLSLYAELNAIRIKDFRYQNETYVAMNCSLVDLCKTSRSVDDIIDLQLPSYMGFLTNVLKLDKSTIVAYLFQNRSSIVINERDFRVFELDDIHISFHSSALGQLLVYKKDKGFILTDIRPVDQICLCEKSQYVLRIQQKQHVIDSLIM